MTTSEVRLSNLISPCFYDVHRAVKKNQYDEYVLKGGRGSTKSSYVSIEAIIQLIKHPNMHAVVLRKVAATLGTSVFNQYIWAIDMMGLNSMFHVTKNPMTITYIKTGQKILFFGVDDPGKIKSLKLPFGYVGIVHFEELDQYAGQEEIRNIEQSILRGGDLYYNFKSFNPPISQNNWANEFAMIEKPGKLVHTSTYLTTPKEWLGQKFFDDAEFLKSINERAYKHEYLGIPTGTGGNVFENLEFRTITDDEIAGFDRIYNGMDWGWYPDPNAFNKCYFNASKRELYLFLEIHCNKTRSTDLAQMLIDKGQDPRERITADKDLNQIADFRSWGWNMRSAVKGPGSVEYSMKWLQSLNKIIIDQKRCPNTAHEFLNYEYDRTRTGDIISGYPDRDNHHIDAVRYAMESVWTRSGK